MNKAAKIFVTVCAVIIMMIATVALTSCAVGGSYETNTYEITEEFTDLTIKVDTSDVSVVPSEDDAVKVVCFERKHEKHEVGVEGDALTVDSVDTRKWYHKISPFGYKTKTVTVYLPKGVYNAVSIRSSTGDISISEGYTFGATSLRASTGSIRMDGAVCGDLVIEVSTGKIDLNGVICDSVSASASTGDVTLRSVISAGAFNTVASTGDTKLESCMAGGAASFKASTGSCSITNGIFGSVYSERDTGDVSINGFTATEFTTIAETGKAEISDAKITSLNAKADTGDVELNGVIVSGSLKVNTSTGDVKFAASDAGEVYIRTSTGSVKGSFLTDKVIFATSDTGKISVPKLTSGGKCEIETETGAIAVTIG